MDRTHRALMGERFGLGRYQSATVDTDSGRRGCATALWQMGTVPVAGAVLAFVIGGVDNAYRTSDLIILAVGTGMVVLGTVLRLIVKPAWQNRFLWYSGGFLLLASGDPQPRVIRWDDVVSLTVTLRSETDEGTQTIDIGSCTVRDRDGNSVTAPAPPDQSLCNGAAELTRGAERALTPRLVPGLIRTFDAGERVVFGDRAWIDHQGITYITNAPNSDSVTTPIAWPDMARIWIGARVSIVISVHTGQDHLIDLDGIENAFFAYHVIERATSAAGIEVRYRDEDDIPDRLPTPAY